MKIEAKVIEDSMSEYGASLVTLELCYPRFIHSELMTHRVFSRNAASSRAIPVAKMIEQVRTNPAMPIHWGKNQPGMQAHEEHSQPVVMGVLESFDNPSDQPLFLMVDEAITIQEAWRRAANGAADMAECMSKAGYHKQVVNRILEPFQWMHTIVTATEWDNFFELRDHDDAEPNIRALAVQMKSAMGKSAPIVRDRDASLSANWHLPYVSQEERDAHPSAGSHLAALSAARCARVSYLTHLKKEPTEADDLALYERLVGSKPLHASPVEHQAYPAQLPHQWDKNFRGWVQHRSAVERIRQCVRRSSTPWLT